MSDTPAAGANRLPLFLALGVLGLIAVGALIFTVGQGDDDPGSASSSETTAPRTETTAPTTTEAPEENPVKVVDEGFANYASDGSPKTGYGFILQNTGDAIVRDVKADIAFFAAADAEIADEDFTVGILRPGEKIGVGGELGGELAGAVVERITVEVPFLPEAVEDPSAVPSGAFQVGNISTEASSMFLHTTFSLTTTYPTEVIFPVGYAVYRNAAGVIVGGARTTGLVDPSGTLVPQAEIETWSIFPGVASTEVYIDPGLTTP